MKRFLCLCAVLTLLLSVLYVPAALAFTDMYVFTANGKTLNVRSSPSTGENKIGALKYGAQVMVDYHRGDGWSVIFWENGPAFVQTRFLVSYQPQPWIPAKDETKPETKTKGSASALDAINEESMQYTPVTPYTVVTTHSRATGLINMRFAPHKQAWLRQSFASGRTLTVIAQLKDWYEVEDPNTGFVGYIRKDFLKTK